MILENSRIPNLEFPKFRHCEALKKPKQSRSKFRQKKGLINEIASSFVSLTPRNDEFCGILEFPKLEFPN